MNKRKNQENIFTTVLITDTGGFFLLNKINKEHNKIMLMI